MGTERVVAKCVCLKTNMFRFCRTQRVKSERLRLMANSSEPNNDATDPPRYRRKLVRKQKESAQVGVITEN